MVDINAKLAIDIEVKDYEQVVRNDKGSLLGTMTKLPAVNSVIKGKVDQTIEEEVKNNLKQTLPKNLADELTKGLRENGVEASVNVSLSY